MSDSHFQRGGTHINKKRRQRKRNQCKNTSDRESKSAKGNEIEARKTTSRTVVNKSPKIGFDKLAEEQGWTVEQLRTSRDLDKKQLPNGTKIIRYPAYVLEDPFKEGQEYNKDPENEYKALETRFYNKLSRVSISNQNKSRIKEQRMSENVVEKAESATTPTTNGTETRQGKQDKQVRVKIVNSSPSDNIRFNVNRTGVDVSVVIPKKSKKKNRENKQ